MIAPIFIEARHLGSTVEARVRQILVTPDKRKRKGEARKLLQLLRFLHLAPQPSQQLTIDGSVDPTPPTGVALGIRADGELGLWLIYDSPTKIQGSIQP
jgi:hypothetical protein